LTATIRESELIRIRIIFFLCAVAVTVVGLASRRYQAVLPVFVGEYSGDTLWALMLFLLVSTLLAGRTVMPRAGISLVLAFLVEISQLYHAPWIDSIRNTTLGGLVLGFGFLWSDLACYTLGIIIGALAECGLRRKLNQKKRRTLRNVTP
jgi:hypothetical protein